ncbi:sensor histidine kinase [Nitrospira sp. Kam-Ns4a]
MAMIGRSVPSYVLLGVGTAVSLLAGPVLQGLWPDWRWQHLPLHSTMEALGGLASIGMAGVLFQRSEYLQGGKYEALGSGLLGMGLLAICHAIAEPGNGFVLLRNMASLVGGVGFASVWRSDSEQAAPRRSWLPWLTATGTVGFGIWVLATPAQVPEMIRSGEFTPTAVAPQSLASLLFFAAAWRLLADYARTDRSEDYLFACLALLFALAELVFMYSVMWDTRWWFWHTLRLAACLLMLGYLGQGYLRIVADLKHSLAQTRQAEETLRRSEHRLKEALDERQRMAEDLHDGAIQALYAIALGLERCQRQAEVAPQETAGRLEAAVKDLQTVIRDLRGYLVGLEAPIRNGQELEAALAALVRSMDSPIQTRFQLTVDPAAAALVTAEQANHLVAIAREAMSNSVRHARAQAGKVLLELRDGHVRFAVEDDGIGFEPAARQPTGHGLKNMEARARKLGGSLSVVSEPGRGTRIICDLPREPAHAST